MEPPSTPNIDPSELPELSFHAREWIASRHEMIAGAAERHLNQRAKNEVTRILRPLGAELSQIAGWADWIKRHHADPNDDDPDTINFLKDRTNAENSRWHYVDLPVDAFEYSREAYAHFTRDDDVVQMISASVVVLMGKSNRFSELNALRLVVHLTGDVHQPLHVGCGYVGDKNGKPLLVRDPSAAQGLKSDRGGNELILPIGAGISLHSHWDGLGEVPPAHQDVAVRTRLRPQHVDKLSNMIALRSPTSGAARVTHAGPPEKWAVRWATSSVLLAREAYRSLEISGLHGGSRPSPSPHGPTANTFDVNWEGRAAYDARCYPIANEQLKNAAANLAELLNAIWS